MGYVVGTYLHKQKAENELARLKASIPDCDDCPYSEEGQESPLETNCQFHKPKYINHNDGWAPYYECENCIDSYDAPSYKMKEYEVIDDENLDDAIVLEENEIEITDSPDIGKTIKCLVDIPHNIKFYLKVRADGKIYIAKVTTSKYGFNDYGFCIQ